MQSAAPARSPLPWALVAALAIAGGCDLSPQPDPPDLQDGADARADDGGTGHDTVGDAALDDGHGADAGPDVGDAAVDDADATPACDRLDPQPPPVDVFWDPRLSAAGTDTLGDEAHDDGLGPAGWCPAGEGAPQYALITAVLQIDEGGESRGEHNIRADVYSAPGERILGLDVVISDGTQEWIVPTTDNPLPEASVVFPMEAGRVYSCRVSGASDEVFNLRMPNGHAVNFVFAFERR